jgi:hypothetical protein
VAARAGLPVPDQPAGGFGAVAPLGDRAILIAAAPGVDPAEQAAWDRALALDWLLAEVRLLPAPQRARVVHALRPGPDGCPGPQSGDSRPG